ncbi:MAG TPA: CoA transferase, partial [Acidimicrobiales bacterium]|nr:CoA transferase [Acidimicrobiales bacterium]
MTAAEDGMAPLEGIRVVDVSRVLSGPFATMVMGDLGAEILKVEDPWAGDDTRQWGPPYQGDQSAYFLSVNRNKRSITLDLKQQAGRRVLQRLAADADVLVENFRPGTAGRLGLGYEELAEANPRLIYVSISGFGQTGPLHEQPGYDAIAQARSGMMSVTGEPDGMPVRSGVATADLAAGMWALIGVLSALRVRERSGRGQWIDVSLLDAQVSWLTYFASGYFATGDAPRRLGSAHPSIVPYQAFPTADGHLMVAVGNDSLWERFVQVLGSPPELLDERFRTNSERVRNRETLLPVVGGLLVRESTGDWLKRFEELGVPVGPIYDVGQALAQEQVLSRDMVVTVDHPTVGEVRMVSSPIRFSRSPRV